MPSPKGLTLKLDMMPEPARSYAREAGIDERHLPFWWAAFALGWDACAVDPTGQSQPAMQVVTRRPLTATDTAAEDTTVLTLPPTVSSSESVSQGEPEWVADIIARAQGMAPQADPERIDVFCRGHKEISAWIKNQESPGIRTIDLVLKAGLERAGFLRDPLGDLD